MAVPLDSDEKTIAAAGTAEPLVATNIYVIAAIVKAKAGNINNIYIGGSNVDNTKRPLAPSDSINLPVPVVNGNTIQINLRDVFIDVDTNGEGVDFWYSEL